MLRHTKWILAGVLLGTCWGAIPAAELEDAFRDPPREFSVMPFWFWNDDLQPAELVRQIADFEAHGVYGFVIHPRIGLPREIGWLSPRMLELMHVAIAEAARRHMYVVLYDEGMYPSGSSSGQVVAKNAAHAARGLWKLDLAAGAKPDLQEGWKLLATLDRPDGQRVAVVERPSGGVVRGLHYVGEGTARLREDTPPAADILNPQAVASFIELVYDRYAQEFGKYFGSTILGVFTDEPSETGRGAPRGLVPGSTEALRRVSEILGYDFTPHLADLWYADQPESNRRRADYYRALHLVLGETYYRPLSDWCARHGVALMGHPGGSTDLGFERYFQMPGQDLVWRYVEPGPKALEGEHSTMAKCAASAMVHLGRRRNSNELYGAYGHNLTFDEVQWLANWCLVRGQNLLFPHAFYYSLRGPRRDERPPDVGPNSAWWGEYRPYADACRRLCWVNTDARQICDVAVLATGQATPDRAAKVLFQHQRDFNYLEARHLREDAQIAADGVHLAGMTYRAVIADGATDHDPAITAALEKLARAGRLIRWQAAPPDLAGARVAQDTAELLTALAALTRPDLKLTPPAPDLRCRHVIKQGRHFYLLFNEGAAAISTRIEVPAAGAWQWWDPATGKIAAAERAAAVSFQPHELKLLSIAAE